MLYTNNMSRNGFSGFRRMTDAEERLERRTLTPFEQLRQQMNDIQGDGGILKEVVQPGEGRPVTENASVLMHYSGFLEYSQQPFETTTHLKHPRMMKLGRDVTLAGLELGLLTMRKGEFSRFLFQPQYAYGDMGCPPIIPAAAVVLYEVQILDFLDSGQVDDFTALSPAEQNTFPLSTLLEVINILRSFGNLCFKQSRYNGAKDRYKQAMLLLGNRDTQSDSEKESIKTAQLPLYLNLSLTELRLENPHKALKYGNKALEIDSGNTKALFRCGQAYLELCEYEHAQHCLLSAQAKKPFDSDINNLLRRAMISYKDSLDQEKDMYSKMFRGLKDPDSSAG
ncbi:inactive peptidyl-prolyl cis-trans isomerase FKBP6 [Parambassis ranga]|uniref:peptidylprolyl isomerase n=1 Tax=Parambassis ranga TaxID=210632 RepID=A0A6P7HI90_9TELE|nr:inactive peptidyl-prolyl cis-trans isomerase FKBP6 [Parambassis ranga]